RSGAKRLYILRAERHRHGRVDPDEWNTCRLTLVHLLGMSSRNPFKPLQKPVDVQGLSFGLVNRQERLEAEG
ncbi:hypothetical protein ACC687_40625, partial [Rhizobium ruizarguesonis]